jgi:hypothetical protein
VARVSRAAKDRDVHRVRGDGAMKVVCIEGDGRVWNLRAPEKGETLMWVGIIHLVVKTAAPWTLFACGMRVNNPTFRMDDTPPVPNCLWCMVMG